jgi:hypothetical protein
MTSAKHTATNHTVGIRIKSTMTKATPSARTLRRRGRPEAKGAPDAEGLPDEEAPDAEGVRRFVP